MKTEMAKTEVWNNQRRRKLEWIWGAGSFSKEEKVQGGGDPDQSRGMCKDRGVFHP